MKKGLIIGLCIGVVVLAVAGGIWYYFSQPNQHVKTIKTDKIGVYESAQEANPVLVGLWSEDANPQHFKAYYDDPCDKEGYFWGKEWNEKEAVFEEDLSYHGNGWFMWNITKDEIVEIHMTDLNTMVVPLEYLIEELNDSTYVYDEFEVAKTIRNRNKKIPVRNFRYHKL